MDGGWTDGWAGRRADEARRRRAGGAREALEAEFRAEDGRQAEEDVRAVLATPEGRRLMMLVADRARVFGSFARDCRGYQDLVYLSGRRDFGCELYELANRSAPGWTRQAFD